MRALHHTPSTQRGVALLTALVILAIAATLSAAMLWRGGLDERRTATLIQGDQAMEYALGAESWAEQILRRDYTDPKNPQRSMYLGQDWAAQLPPLPVEGGQITGHIEDMQGRFNLDLLQGHPCNASSGYFTQLQRLLTTLDQDPSIADAVCEWVNTGSIPTQPGGAKDDFYTRLQPPYLTAETAMTSVSELQLVKGVTPQVYAMLSPYVCAIPLGAAPTSAPSVTATSGWALNLNTAPPPVLMSLAQNVTEDQVQAIVDARATQGLTPTTLAQLNIKLPTQGTGAAALATGYSSNYFLLTVTAEIGSTHVTLYSLLRISGNQVTAVRRTLGTL